MRPNPRITKLIFNTIDKDENQYMEFNEFMDFMLMMNYGDIEHKAEFVFDLISQTVPLTSITFREVVIFYFKIIDEFGNSENPDLLINEDFGEYIDGSLEEKEIFLGELDRNLVASISLADVFFNLIQADLRKSIPKEEFVEFMSMYPRTMDLFNFIDISAKDFKNIQSINKTKQYMELIGRIINDVENIMGAGNQIPNVSQVKKTVKISNMENILEKVDKIQKEIEHSIEQSFQQENENPKSNTFFLVNIRNHQFNKKKGE